MTSEWKLSKLSCVKSLVYEPSISLPCADLYYILASVPGLSWSPTILHSSSETFLGRFCNWFLKNMRNFYRVQFSCNMQGWNQLWDFAMYGKFRVFYYRFSHPLKLRGVWRRIQLCKKMCIWSPLCTSNSYVLFAQKINEDLISWDHKASKRPNPCNNPLSIPGASLFCFDVFWVK